MISPSPGCLQSSVCSSSPYIHRLQAVSLFSWSSKMQMTARVTEGARRERHKTERSSRAAALVFASLRFTARRSRARAFP